MKFPIYILLIFFIALTPGCAFYHGYRDYEELRPLKKEGESVIAEKYRLEKKEDTVIVRRFRHYKYTQTYRKYAVNERLYNNFNGFLFLPHIISYPLTLVLSPFALFGDDENIYEQGNTYIYTSGRKFWNWINPFISCFHGPSEFEITVSSHRDVKFTEYREDDCIVDGAEINITLRDGRKLVRPAGTSISRLRKDVFEYPLPERKEVVEITFKNARIDFEIASADLPQGQLDDWNKITRASAKEALANEKEYIDVLKRFLEEKNISQDTFESERKRLNNLVAEERERLAAEKAKQIQEAKDTYEKLTATFDKLTAFSQKGKMTNAEYEDVINCAKSLLDCEGCEAAIALLNKEGVISDDVARQRMKCLRYARESVMYPCRNVYNSNIVLYENLRAGVSEYYLRGKHYAPDFMFTEVRGHQVAYGCRYKVDAEQEIENIKRDFQSKYSDLHIRDKSRANDVFDDVLTEFQLRGQGFLTFEASFVSYDVTLENDDVLITISGNKIKTNIETIFLSHNPDIDYKLQKIKAAFDAQVYNILSRKGIADGIYITISDKRLKGLSKASTEVKDSLYYD